jgi:hypothetical protein
VINKLVSFSSYYYYHELDKNCRPWYGHIIDARHARITEETVVKYGYAHVMTAYGCITQDPHVLTPGNKDLSGYLSPYFRGKTPTRKLEAVRFKNPHRCCTWRPVRRKYKGKTFPQQTYGGAGGRMYSSYSFTTSALEGGEWSASRPGHALAPGKGTTVPIVQEAGWAPEPVWTERLEEKSFRLCRESKLVRPVVQPVARHYIDWATPAQFIVYLHRKLK